MTDEACVVCSADAEDHYCQVCKHTICADCLTDHICGQPSPRELWGVDAQ